ncbi:TetR/AcrR family transcriptional regulator [Leucobacter sp. wl10]|uniref:TetR/AcrR family transcriptional regulator n=1 Tax=Leucobacter sp. wl10 TaxID=2304677 RepID=UPI000E5B7FB4|nr:TetR/AcrR family transcriptional regulator [Leucobacter sp. wl10]RGE20741.1 TetR/AcrR family transcriptional regulator [Leucobacter sp. wl10]
MSTPSARRQETRARLLDAATEVFVEGGLQGSSVEAVCARAGFTRGAFYSNFSSKEQLLLALLEREFEQRAESLAVRARELEPTLRERSGCISPAEAGRYVVEFFAPASDATAWFVLETEFLLLAMRDPSIAPGHHEFMDRFYTSISGAVERVVSAAGRRFVIPVERAIPVFSGVYERALRTAALAGPHTDGGFDELGDRLAELLFALTEEVGDEAGSGTETASADERPPLPAGEQAPGPGFIPPTGLRLF